MDNDQVDDARMEQQRQDDEEDEAGSPPPYKKQRQLALAQNDTDETTTTSIRTSSLSSPTLKLTGHRGSIYTLSYSPCGSFLCSGSFDMTCLLWNHSSSRYENYNVLRGHRNAILDVKWNTVDRGERIVTAGADWNLGWYDSSTGERIKRFMGHEGVVNSVDVIPTGTSPLLISGSDDCTCKLWDARVRRRGNDEVGTLKHKYQITAVAYGMDGGASTTVYTGGIDNCIHAWDVRRMEKIMSMMGHTDTITSLALHPKGTHLLSNSMDGTLRTWDIRPFVTTNSKRHCKTFVGATHSAEKGLLNCAWSADGTMVTAGSADRIVHVWDEITTEELYYLPGHKGCVNAVIFHPKENVIASGSSDKSIFVGELGQ